MKPVKIKIDPENKIPHTEQIISHLKEAGFEMRVQKSNKDLGFHGEHVFGIFGGVDGKISYTTDVDTFIGYRGDEIQIPYQWTPQNGEKIEVRNTHEFDYQKGEFIGMHEGFYVANVIPHGYTAWVEARPYNAIQQEIDQLEARLAELKEKL